MSVYASYPMESSTMNVPDTSGNDRYGTVIKPGMVDPDWVPGYVGNCMYYSGTDYILLGDIANFERTDAFSVAAWFKTTTDSKIIISRIDADAPYRGWSVYIAGGKIAFQLTHDNSPANRIVLTGDTTNLHDGAWHHVIMTYDGSSAAAGVTLYIDGSAETPSVLADSLSLTTQNSIDCEIGARDGADAAWVGYIDEVIIYDAELSSGEAAALYATYFTEMNVKGNGVSITNGDTEPSATDDTAFGTHALGANEDHEFTVENAGSVNLLLDGDPKVALSGTHAADFEVTAQPSSPVAPSGSTTFTVRFTPSAEGVRIAEVSIDNNDADEDPYTFAIWGAGTSAVGGSVGRSFQPTHGV